MSEVTSLDDLRQKLELYKDFDVDPENCEKFLEVVDEIVLKNDPDCIASLIDCLIEIKNADWVNEILLNNILHYIKKYERSREILANKLCRMIYSSPEWCENLFSIFLNEHENFDKFLQIMKKQDEGIIHHLFSLIKSGSPYHAQLLQELKLELSKEKQ